MKKIVFAAAIAAAGMFSSAAMAQAYVSAAVGQGHLDDDCTGIEACDNTGTASKFVGGYHFGGGLSAEVGYLDFGKASFRDGTLSGNVKAAGLTVGVAFRAPLGERFGLSARVGAARLKSKVNATLAGVGSASESETHTKAYFGVGADYVINKNFRVEAGVDFSKAELFDAQGDVRAITVGARFDF
jgi:hypothetical protein